MSTSLNAHPLSKTRKHTGRMGSNPVSLLVISALIFSALVYAIYLWSAHVNSELRTIQFNKDSMKHADAVRAALATHIKTIKTLGAFFNHAHLITQDEFHLFADSLLQASPHMQALAWAPKISLAERQEYEQGDMEAIPGFQITEFDNYGLLVKAATHPDYYPVSYIDPYPINRPALGFDLASTESNRSVMNQAADSGQVTISSHTASFPGREKDDFQLTFFPIYQNGAWPEDMAHHRKTLKGFVLSVFEIGSMLQQTIMQSGNPEVDIWIFGAPLDQEERLLFASREKNSVIPIDPVPSSGLFFEFDMGGYQWRVISTPLSTAPVIHQPMYYYSQLAILGVFILGLVLIHLSKVQKSARSLEKANMALDSSISRLRESEATLRKHDHDLDIAFQQVDLERNRLADAIDSLDTAIAIFDADECLITCNSKFLDTYPELRDKISPGISYKTMLEEYFNAARLHSQTKKSRDTWVDTWLNMFRQHETGVLRQHNDTWLLISEYPTSEGGTVSLRSDITSIKNAEMEIRALNRTHAVLSSSSTSLAKASDEQSLLSAFCENATRVGGYHTSLVLYTPGPDATSVQLKAISVHNGNNSAEMANTDPHEIPVDFSLSEIAIDTQQTIVMNNLKNESHEAFSKMQNSPFTYKSMIAIPLRIDTAVIGCFSIYSTEKDSFNEQEKKLLQELAEILSKGIATMRARAAREQKMLQFKIKVEHNERRRIAATLHDGVAQTMQAVNLNLKNVRTLVRQQQELPQELLNKIIGNVEVTINDLREISHNLRPVILEKMNIVDAIRHYCSELSTQREMIIHVSDHAQNCELNPISKEQCFISFREAMSNALRHAEATRVDVVMENRAPGSLSIQIRDNGTGFNTDDNRRPPSGLGISMISERMHSIGGAANIYSSPGKGTVVTLITPLEI